MKNKMRKNSRKSWAISFAMLILMAVSLPALARDCLEGRKCRRGFFLADGKCQFKDICADGRGSIDDTCVNLCWDLVPPVDGVCPASGRAGGDRCADLIFSPSVVRSSPPPPVPLPHSPAEKIGVDGPLPQEVDPRESDRLSPSEARQPSRALPKECVGRTFFSKDPGKLVVLSNGEVAALLIQYFQDLDQLVGGEQDVNLIVQFYQGGGLVSRGFRYNLWYALSGVEREGKIAASFARNIADLIEAPLEFAKENQADLVCGGRGL